MPKEETIEAAIATTKSALYTGVVAHNRIVPKPHKFSYRMFFMYLNLDELPRLFDRYWFWSVGGFNLAQFRRKDHVPGKPNLKETVLDDVEKSLGFRPKGPVTLLTNLRYFGYVINPVSFYYCFDDDNETLVAVVAEVHNTPWGELHTYVIDASPEYLSDSLHCFEHCKEFHVSPFMSLDMNYRWSLSGPKKWLRVHISNYENEQKMFTASMNLKRNEINSKTLAKTLISYPFMTLKVVFAIYYQALKLWLKKIPIYPHPNRSIKNKKQ